MKWLLVLFLSLLTLPALSNAASIPESSEVLLIYNNANEEQQTRYNFIYTVDDDSTVYTCATNRCSTAAFRDRGTINMTVYKLPDGFPRVANIVDQKLLKEYVELAEQSYWIENVITNQSTAEDGRQYLKVFLSPDGSVVLESANYDKPEMNRLNLADNDNTGSIWYLIIIGIAGAVVVIVLVVLLMKLLKKRKENIQ